MPKSHIHLPLTEEHYNAIGHVTARAVALDAVIDVAIWKILGVDEIRGRILTTRRDTTDKLKRLKALCKEFVREHDDIRIPHILGAAHRANKERNQIIHALWAAGDTDDPVGHRYEINDGLQKFSDEWPATKIQGVAKKLENAAGDILDFLRLLQPNESVTMPRKSDFDGLSEHDNGD